MQLLNGWSPLVDIYDPVSTIQKVGILETLGISLSCEDCHNCKTATFLVTENVWKIPGARSWMERSNKWRRYTHNLCHFRVVIHKGFCSNCKNAQICTTWAIRSAKLRPGNMAYKTLIHVCWLCGENDPANLDIQISICHFVLNSKNWAIKYI